MNNAFAISHSMHQIIGKFVQSDCKTRPEHAQYYFRSITLIQTKNLCIIHIIIYLY